MTNTMQDRILGGLWGSVVGDALGVPVEFMSREQVRRNPITEMRGYGTFNLPPGSWSDDSSLLLCTVENLLNGLDTSRMGELFTRWLNEGYWTPWGETFDVGNSTMSSIRRMMKGVPPEELLDAVHRISSITHRHPRTLMACGFYCLMVRALMEGSSPDEAYKFAIDQARVNYTKMPFAEELNHFERLFSGLMGSVPETAIKSSGYVVHTLEASIWCLLNSNSFQEAVLMAVNLGEDTDTTGCVTGGLAGAYYGLKTIPKDWLNTIAREEDVGNLFERFAGKI
jgi:ADP-ribosyl-[dinitrogen reductase] hydrolase